MGFLDKILGFFGIHPKEQNYEQGEIIGDAPIANDEVSTEEKDINPEASAAPDSSEETLEIPSEQTIAEGEKIEEPEVETPAPVVEEESPKTMPESEGVEEKKEPEPKEELLGQSPATSVEELEDRLGKGPEPEITAEEGGPSDSGDNSGLEYNSGDDV